MTPGSPISPNAAPATGSTRSAASAHNGERGRSFPCEQCGAELAFSIGQQELACPYCGHKKSLDPPPGALAEQDLDAMLAKLAALRGKQADAAAGTHEVQCGSCGGTVAFVGTLTSSECPYCGSPLQRENVHESPVRVPVDGVLPFHVAREAAAENLRQWVRSRWFAPNEFRQRGAQGQFNGVYLPYWTFDAVTFNHFSGQRGEHYQVTVGSGKDEHTETRTRWIPVSGSFQQVFDDVLCAASAGLPDSLTVALEPWPLNQCAPFRREYLAGFLARTYDMPLDRGLLDAKGRMAEAIQVSVRSRIGGNEQRVDSVVTQYSALTYKHLLLPLWLLTYRYRDKPYRVLVNAATGEVQGERPWSWVKIALAVLAAVVAVGMVAGLRG